MKKKLSVIGKLLYGLAIGDALGNLNEETALKILKSSSFLNKPSFKFSWTPTTGLSLAITDSISTNFSRVNIMHRFADWWVRDFYSMNKIKQSNRFSTEIQAIINFESNHEFNLIGVKENVKNDENVLARILPVAVYEFSRFGTGFINNEESMDDIQSVVSLTHDYPLAIMSASMISFLISQIISKEQLHQALENSVAITYEYYFRRTIFQTELSNFSRLNMPDISSIKLNELVQDGSVIHTLENIYWVLSSSNNLLEALKIAIKSFPKQRQTLISVIYAIYSLINRDNINEKMINKIDENPVVNNSLTLANKSNKFRLKSLK